MSIATAMQRGELRQEFNVPSNQGRHFTPVGVSGSHTLVTINIALLPEGKDNEDASNRGRDVSSTRVPRWD